MHISPLATIDPPAILEAAAALLVEGFDEPRGWPTMELAREEVTTVLHEGFAFAALEGDALLGWIAGLPEYAGRVWELHHSSSGARPDAWGWDGS